MVYVGEFKSLTELSEGDVVIQRRLDSVGFEEWIIGRVVTKRGGLFFRRDRKELEWLRSDCGVPTWKNDCIGRPLCSPSEKDRAEALAKYMVAKYMVEKQ